MLLALADPAWMPLVGGGAAFLAMLLLTPVIIRGARRRGWVDRPQKDRWHKKPTALMGGVAIYVSASLAWALVAPSLASGAPWILWGGASLMFVTGLVDDLRGLAPATKLILQVAAAVLLLYAGPLFETGPHWLSIPLTFLWVIGITNAVNLLDNMDGLAAGIAAIAAAVLAIYALLIGNLAVATALLAVAGAAAGFLVFNFKPARIFMGDSGSLFLGYTIAVFAVAAQGAIGGVGSTSAGSPAAYLVSAAVLAVPIFDTTLVTIARTLSGRAVSQGGQDHSSHRLVFLGLSERRAVLTLYGISIAFGALALTFHVAEVQLFFALATFFIVGLAVLGVHLSRANIYRGTSPNNGHHAPNNGHHALQGVTARNGATSQHGATTRNGRAAPNGSAHTGPEGAPSGDYVPLQGKPSALGALLGRSSSIPTPRSLMHQGVTVMRAVLGHRWKSVVEMVTDLLLIAAAFVLAHYLRFENGLSPARELFLIKALPGVVGIKLAVFFAARLYRGLWQHAGTPELVRIGQASTGASVLCYGALAMFYGTDFLSEAAFFIDWMVVTLAVVGVRFAFRGLRQYLSSKRQSGRRVLLYGAGDSGQLTLRGLRQQTDLGMTPIGFIDDDPGKQGLTAQGLSVLGTFKDLEDVCKNHRVEEVLITTFRMPTAHKQEVLHRCKNIGIDCRIFSLALRAVSPKTSRPTAPAPPLQDSIVPAD